MNRKKVFSWLALWAVVFQTASVKAEDDWRTWTSKAGTTLEARVVKQNGQTIVLEKKEGGGKITLKLRQLSQADQKYIKSLQEKPENKGATTVPGIDAHPGKTSAAIHCVSNAKWTYFLYLPKGFHSGKKWPVWFIMAAGGGRGDRDLKRYKVGADRLGCVLALSVQSKNNFADSDVAMAAMVDDVYERLPVIEKLGFATGMSGGSRMAFLMAERDKRVSGILACGSGQGVYLKEKDYREAKLRRSTYVYSLIGTNCFNRSEAVTTHNTYPDHYRLRFFPGKHAWARSPLIEEGMARVMGEALARNKDRGLDPLKKAYANTMWTWTQEMSEKQPWEAAYWAEFLVDFYGDRAVQNKAEKLLKTLENNPQVLLANEANKEIHQFCNKYYNRYISVPERKKRNPAREAHAEKLAEKFKGLPHAKVIKRLGKPS